MLKGFPHVVSFDSQSNDPAGRYCHPYFTEEDTEAKSATVLGDTVNRPLRHAWSRSVWRQGLGLSHCTVLDLECDLGSLKNFFLLNVEDTNFDAYTYGRF